MAEEIILPHLQENVKSTLTIFFRSDKTPDRASKNLVRWMKSAGKSVSRYIVVCDSVNAGREWQEEVPQCLIILGYNSETIKLIRLQQQERNIRTGNLTTTVLAIDVDNIPRGDVELEHLAYSARHTGVFCAVNSEIVPFNLARKIRDLDIHVGLCRKISPRKLESIYQMFDKQNARSYSDFEQLYKITTDMENYLVTDNRCTEYWWF
jgi:hypothetical protein